MKILKIPTTVESKWIKQNCRKGWSEPTGHREWLREYWRSGAANFATLPHISSEDETENWWQRCIDIMQLFSYNYIYVIVKLFDEIIINSCFI